ncbi:RWD-domain-containing protein [Fomitopsis serialis]|uniref:RWD-domain-containing protein n=1 Tax=Fomitopsis serialis TaxID=139415 RepID=UPI002008451E|nr:RWD-domain-containing protein [Neoantrodia serialis]KAH9934793.1 RWD-domain-containing protein [Neoantrodia serialis]
MSSEVLQEEFEVLEAIYPTELTSTTLRKGIRIDVEPDDPLEGEERVLNYTDEYPDALPELSLETLEGSVEENEIENLLAELRTVGEENLGMAMTFTLASHLRERLSALIRTRAELRQQEDTEKERQAIEAEEARTRGTPVTVENFNAWKAKFDKAQAIKKAREDEEKLRGMTAKEREEYKKLATRLSGRQLFERDRTLAISDDSMIEEGVVSVDISQYDRVVMEEDEEEERVTFSDSD